jgi:hypothetical protein
VDKDEEAGFQWARRAAELGWLSFHMTDLCMSYQYHMVD